MKFRTMMRRCALLMAAMFLFAAPARGDSYSAIVTSKKMTVYADEGLIWSLGTLSMATVVTAEDVSDTVVKVTLSGNTGYASLSDLASIESLATPVRVTKNTYVFQKPSTSSKYVKVKKGMEINLLATSGKWAMVENNGVIAYMNKNQLEVIEDDEEEEDEDDEEDDSSDDVGTVITETFEAVVTAESMPVYKSYSTSSTYLGSVTEGTVVTVYAYNSTWAYISLNGNYGYAQISYMSRVTSSDDDSDDDSSSTTTTASYLTSSSYTVEQKIYLFLTREMGLNTAAACGVLANVQKECSFVVTASSSDGGYGIVQWTGSRKTRLQTWCSNNGYDYTTITGQLYYLEYELENYYTKTLKYLQNVENSALGAYEAGYYFCYYFEVPSNRAARAVERGNLAKDTYWVKYAA